MLECSGNRAADWRGCLEQDHSFVRSQKDQFLVRMWEISFLRFLDHSV